MQEIIYYGADHPQAGEVKEIIDHPQDVQSPDQEAEKKAILREQAITAAEEGRLGDAIVLLIKMGD